MDDDQSESNEKNEIKFQNLMDKESVDRFNKPWAKLDKGTKINRLQLFITLEKVNKSLTTLQEKQLRILLLSRLDMGELNKKTNIIYEPENKKILEIKNLIFDDTTKNYHFDNTEKKPEKKSKSKSNIDRHFKKKN